MSDAVNTRREGGKLIVELDEAMLVFAAEHHPTHRIRVTNQDEFLDQVAEALTSYGDTGDFDSQPQLFTLLDDIFVFAAEIDAGAEAVEVADD